MASPEPKPEPSFLKTHLLLNMSNNVRMPTLAYGSLGRTSFKSGALQFPVKFLFCF